MLIDLGTDRTHAVGPEPWVPGRAGRLLAAVDRRTRALVAVALVLLVAIVPGLGGAAVWPRLTKVLSLPAGVHAYAVADGLLAMMTVPDNVPTLSAYRLRDGTPLWTKTSSSPVSPESSFYIAIFGDVLMVVAGVPNRLSHETVAYDRATGEQLWRFTGRPVGRLDGGRVLMVNPVPDPCPYPPCDRFDEYLEMPHDLAALDLRTARVGWTVGLTGPENASLAFDVWSDSTEAMRRMAALDATGRLRTWDMGTGTLLASRALPPVEDDRALLFVDNVLLVSVGDQSGAVRPTLRYSAYEAATLEPRWRTDPVPIVGGVWRCGERLCLSTLGDSIAVDLRTGAQTRQGHAWQWVSDMGGGHQLGYPVGDPEAPTPRWVLDAAGEPLFALSGWDSTIPWPGRTYALMTQYDAATSRVYFGVLDAARRGVVPLGTVVGAAGSCEPTPAPGGGYLICWMTGERIQVYRYAA